MSLLVAATFLPRSFFLDQTLKKEKMGRERESEREEEKGRKKNRSPNR
jgi:hypothetical protein